VSQKRGATKLPFLRKSAKPKTFLDEAGLYGYAIRSLGRQMRTAADLRRLLQQRAEPGERGEAATDAVIARLKDQHYLDDQSYAETYTRLRKENEKFGQRRVRNDLRQKGISAGLIAKTLEASYAQTDEETLARKHLARKRIHKPENEKEIARVMRRLVAAGFSTGVIYKILRQWDVPDESLAALDNLAEEPHGE
jgi:regulatory protein